MIPKRILWLSWKDKGHPQSGGAEVVLHEVAKRQAAAGHEVTILTAGYDHAPAGETVDGVEIIRVVGNRYTHPLWGLAYYLRYMRGEYDVVIETVNTAPYFASLFPKNAKAAVLYHQMAREVWLHEMPKPIGLFGFHVLEPIATNLLTFGDQTVLSMSPSTTDDLVRFGYDPDRIHLVREGIELSPVPSLKHINKWPHPTILSLGSIRGMKRTLDQIKAFEHLKRLLPEAKMIVAGAPFGRYGQDVLKAIAHSPYESDISYRGRVSQAEKRRLMQRCHVIWVTSIKEGWGLIVSEANGQGTPAVVYDADGLRDSVQHNQTGMICKPDPKDLAITTVKVLTDARLYNRLRKNAHAFSRTLTFDGTFEDIAKALDL